MKKLIVFLTLVIVLGLAGQAYAISLGDFFSFGAGAGDSRLAPNDDGSTGAIALGSAITYFGTPYSTLWVNNNGNVTFDGSMSTFTPFAFPSGRKIIAPYFGDVDTRNSGNPGGDSLNDVYYSERSGASDLSALSSVVNATFGGSFSAARGFVSTWDHTGYYNSHNSLLNTFQLGLATDGTGNSFAIFNYLDEGMAWETGDDSGGSGGFGGNEATAGFDAGDFINFYTIPGSALPGIANVLEDGSNRGRAGQWVFRINTGTIVPPPPTAVVPEPATMALFGLGLAGLVRLKRRKISA